MCGIFGKIAIKEENLELSHFNILGFFNDERGGDSVGIFIDGDLEIGVDENKKYKDFLKNSKLLNEVTTAKIAIGHTRKASIGKINVETAQPVCITDSDGKAEFVLMHNGTIFNYSELAKKHIPFMDIKDLTDTQVMANIFYFCGYDVLTEYEGAGAFVIVDYRELKNGNPEVLFFKGASSKYKYSKEIEEERPLYLTISDKSIWFSSIDKPLAALNYPLEALTIRSNTLIKVGFKGKMSLSCVKEYDRSEKFQYKSTYQSDSEYTGYAKTYSHNYSKWNKESSKSDKTSNITSINKIKDAEELWVSIDDNLVKDKVSLYKDGLYYMNRKKAHGPIVLNFYGYLQKNEYQIHNNYTYYFFEGRLLPNESSFKLLKKATETISETPEHFGIKYSECIDKYSYVPVVQVPEKDGSITFFEQEDFDTAYLFTGNFIPMFSFNNFNFHIKDGAIKSRSIGAPIDCRKYFDAFVRAWDEDVVQFGEELEDMLSYIYNTDELNEYNK